MRAVEQQYAVVGLVEDWDTSLAVMERLVPRFFTGAPAIYRGEPELCSVRSTYLEYRCNIFPKLHYRHRTAPREYG